MARSGIYFSDFKRARDGLLADGRHPSLDAVRAAMGNTGSKSTIHKFLREIDSEQETPKTNASDDSGTCDAACSAA